MQEQKPETNNTTTNQIITKVSTSENILIALSQNPTADELAAAIGLSILLDKIGKHATAIYSGETPSIIEFLEPEQRLETNTDSLQDFIIALNKDKADHLHYKVDGDYVKIYITPYKTKISEEDLEFSYGDFNIGLVVALNVENENSLDQALTSHGRILHDAEVINITASAPGDFGNIQWSDPAASSISEMVAELAFLIGGELGVEIDGEVATALLTGIFVATDRFSNNRTQPETMNMAARLMEVGANQQLISEYMRKTEDEEGEKNNGVDDQADEGKGEAQEYTGRIEDDKEDESLLTIQREESDKTGINKQDEYVQDAHTENEQSAQGEQLNQDTQAQSTNESKTDQPVIEQENGSEPAEEAANTSIASQRPVLKPLGQSGGSEGAGLNIQNPSSVNLTPLGGLKDSPRGEVSQDEKTSSIKMDTPFEETPAPAFVDNKDDTMVGVPAPQPVVGNGDKTNSLASLGAKSSVDESVMNELKNLPDNPAPLGKDYSAVEVPASEALSGHEYMSDNPASAAAPGVSEGPEENHLPGLDFSNPVSMTEDEPAASQNNNSYIIESTSSEPVSQNVTGGVNLQPLTQDIPSATLEPKPQGMPLPGDEVLPPPPTPPIDFASVQPEQPAPEPAVQPVQATPVFQPTQTEPQSPGLPPVDQSILGNEAVAAPTSFQQPQAQPQAQAPVTPPVAPTNDPGAFRIPGT